MKPASPRTSGRTGPRGGRAGACLGVVTPLFAQRMPTADELNAWMQAVALQQDRRAFAALFRHFAPRLVSYHRRCGATEAQAEELVQEAMVVLWRRAATFDPSRAQLSTWLFTIARNVRISQLRRQVVGEATGPASMDGVDVDADLQPGDATLEPSQQAEASERERSVQGALLSLPPEQAAVMRLSFFDEHPHAQIASELGIPLGTVKSRIRLAVAHLRRLLGDFER